MAQLHLRQNADGCISGVYIGRKRTLDDQVGPENTHGTDTNTGLGGTVCGTEAGEDDGAHATHRSEERLLWQVSA